MQNTALRIDLDNRSRLWYNMPMQTETSVTPPRIIPRSSQAQYAYAYGFLRGNLHSLFAIANGGYYSSSEDRIAQLEEQIHHIETLMHQIESELYPNDSE